MQIIIIYGRGNTFSQKKNQNCSLIWQFGVSTRHSISLFYKKTEQVLLSVWMFLLHNDILYRVFDHLKCKQHWQMSNWCSCHSSHSSNLIVSNKMYSKWLTDQFGQRLYWFYEGWRTGLVTQTFKSWKPWIKKRIWVWKWKSCAIGLFYLRAAKL